MKSITDSMMHNGGNSCRADKERAQKQKRCAVRLVSCLVIAVIAFSVPLIGVTV